LNPQSYHGYYVVLHAHVKHFKLVGAGLNVAHDNGRSGKRAEQNRRSVISYTADKYDFNLTDFLELISFLDLDESPHLREEMHMMYKIGVSIAESLGQ
jgi:hypothetical protein